MGRDYFVKHIGFMHFEVWWRWSDRRVERVSGASEWKVTWGHRIYRRLTALKIAQEARQAYNEGYSDAAVPELVSNEHYAPAPLGEPARILLRYHDVTPAGAFAGNLKFGTKTALQDARDHAAKMLADYNLGVDTARPVAILRVHERNT